MKKSIVMLAAILLMTACLAPLCGQETRPQMKTEIVRLKYADARQLGSMLEVYLSKEGRIRSEMTQQPKLIVVNDYPEFVDKILSVIKEVDVKPPDILLTAQMVLGSSSEKDKNEEFLQNDPVVKELKALLMYKNFALLDTNFIRAADGEWGRMTLGKNAEFALEFNPRYTKDGNDECIRSEIRLIFLGKYEPAPAGTEAQTRSPQQESKALLSTTLTLKPDEKTVLGVSKLDGGDKGLILILSGKVIR